MGPVAQACGSELSALNAAGSLGRECKVVLCEKVSVSKMPKTRLTAKLCSTPTWVFSNDRYAWLDTEFEEAVIWDLALRKSLAPDKLCRLHIIDLQNYVTCQLSVSGDWGSTWVVKPGVLGCRQSMSWISERDIVDCGKSNSGRGGNRWTWMKTT